MAYYIVFVLVGEFGSYVVGRTVEQWSPTSSLPVFLGCFFVVFWLAWVLAVRITEPKKTPKAA
jgi:hypothetical protein